MTKNCTQCQKSVNIKPYRSDTFRFCSANCRYVSMQSRTPWNKGIKGIHLSPTTEFKKGIKPWNTGKAYRASCLTCGEKTSQWNSRDKPTRCRSCVYELARTVKEFHPRWIKDRDSVVKSEKKHLDTNYKVWMQAVKNRDGWACKMTNGDCSGRLEAHHILRWSDFPELRYEVNNGITLCHFHHPRKQVDENRLSPYFRELIGKTH